MNEKVLGELRAMQPYETVPSPTPDPNAPWDTYTATSGQTNYRAKGEVSGVPYGYIEYLPAGYDSAAAAYYPLVIYLHPEAQKGTGSAAALAQLRNAFNAAGVQYNIDHGKFYRAVVLTPQLDAAWWGMAEIGQLVDAAVTRYKVNPKRILITGFSQGGGAAWDYVANNTAKVAALLPISSTSDCTAGTISNVPSGGVKVWSFHSIDDSYATYLYSISCMTKIGVALGQVVNVMDAYASGSPTDQTTHFNPATKRWAWESEVDCEDSQNHPWPNRICQTLFKTGGAAALGRVYQDGNDAPMIWLLNQKRD